MKSILLCGVGGQGTVLASRIIASAAMKKGLFARTAETIGMAQRGGCVVSHVRIGDEVDSPLIPYGKADVILGFEPGEVIRNLSYLKKDGIVIVIDQEISPVTASLSQQEYRGETLIFTLKSNVENCYVLSSDKIIKECKNSKVLNVALVGAAVQCRALDFDLSEVEEILEEKLPSKFLELNRKALHLGANIVKGDIL